MCPKLINVIYSTFVSETFIEKSLSDVVTHIHKKKQHFIREKNYEIYTSLELFVGISLLIFKV